MIRNQRPRRPASRQRNARRFELVAKDRIDLPSARDHCTPVGAGNRVAVCDLGIFIDQASEAVPSQHPDVCARIRLIRTTGRRTLAQCPVRPVRVVVIDIL